MPGHVFSCYVVEIYHGLQMEVVSLPNPFSCRRGAKKLLGGESKTDRTLFAILAQKRAVNIKLVEP